MDGEAGLIQYGDPGAENGGLREKHTSMLIGVTGHDGLGDNTYIAVK